MALTLTTDTIALVHTSDDSANIPDEHVGSGAWLPASMCEPHDGATIVEVRALTGVEFAKAAACGDRASELDYTLSTAVVSIDGDAKKASSARRWIYSLANPLHNAIVHLSTGGALPLDLPEQQGSTATT